MTVGKTILFTHPYRLSLLNKGSNDRVVSAYYDNAQPEDLEIPDELIAADVNTRMPNIVKFCSQNAVDAVVLSSSHDDECVKEVLYSHQLRQLGSRVVGLNRGACELFNDKAATKDFLAANDVPVVDSIDIVQLLKNYRSDIALVAKPKELWAGTGIEILRSKEEAAAHWRDTDGTDCIYEPFQSGYEISVQILSYKDRVIVCPPVYKSETTMDLTHPLKKLRVFPCPRSIHLKEQLEDIAHLIVDKLLVCGVIEFEAIVTTDGLKVLEVNGRMSGVTRMIACAGINAIDALYGMACNTWEDFNAEVTGVSAEIPIIGEMEDEIERDLRQHRDVKYYYVRKDSGVTRRRILVHKENYEGLHDLIVNSDISSVIDRQYIDVDVFKK